MSQRLNQGPETPEQAAGHKLSGRPTDFDVFRTVPYQYKVQQYGTLRCAAAAPQREQNFNSPNSTPESCPSMSELDVSCSWFY